jgi:hypothetical protein
VPLGLVHLLRVAVDDADGRPVPVDLGRERQPGRPCPDNEDVDVCGWARHPANVRDGWCATDDCRASAWSTR